ncbi:uncharacterized protein LOC129614800 [Condylostylus longicornis]|uniref:uncharacterized protein LOC129614800 n=1 Tax=Condylostylus longicornis TaxID=2530218 RepID=UPI00244E495A|nr:uncharacterized protein LOC129614800 [Condylostylus longicornis]
MLLEKAIYAGLCGAIGSVFGKYITYSFDTIIWSYFLQILCLVLMILFNTLNMRFFVNSLQESNNSLSPTVTSFAANFFFSFAFGVFIFKEKTSFISVLGIILIIFGLYYLCDTKHKNEGVITHEGTKNKLH